jgi:hypothetical protein
MTESDICQLEISPDGKLIFPDEQGAAVIAQALLEGRHFHRLLDRDLPPTAQPRAVKIIVGVSHSSDGSTGTNYYVASPVSHPDQPVLSLSQHLTENPVLSPENDGPRKISTVRKHGASKADFSPPRSGEPRNQPAMTLYGRILLNLVTAGDELLTALIPGSDRLADPEIRQKVSQFSDHQLQKLSGGFGNRESREAYSDIGGLIQSFNTLGQQLFISDISDVPW